MYVCMYVSGRSIRPPVSNPAPSVSTSSNPAPQCRIQPPSVSTSSNPAPFRKSLDSPALKQLITERFQRFRNGYSMEPLFLIMYSVILFTFLSFPNSLNVLSVLSTVCYYLALKSGYELVAPTHIQYNTSHLSHTPLQSIN